MTGHALSLMIAILAGFVSKIAIDKWINWNARVNNPILGEGMEKIEQGNMATSAVIYTLVSSVLVAVSYTIPPDILITIVSK